MAEAFLVIKNRNAPRPDFQEQQVFHLLRPYRLFHFREAPDHALARMPDFLRVAQDFSLRFNR